MTKIYKNKKHYNYYRNNDWNSGLNNGWKYQQYTLKTHCFIIMLLNLILINPCFAIVNMEDLHLGTSVDGFTGEVNFAAAGSSGNTQKTVATLGSRLLWYQQKITYFTFLNYTYGKSQNQVDTNKGFLHLRALYEYQKNNNWEIFVQIQTDEFTRLSLRSLLGAGHRVTLIDNKDKNKAILGSGLFFEHEKLDEKVGTTDDTSVNAWRANIYFIIKHQLNTAVSLQNSLYYQPDLADFSDFHLIEIATLNVKLTDQLALKININVSHDGAPPQSVEKTDVRYFTGLVFKF